MAVQMWRWEHDTFRSRCECQRREYEAYYGTGNTTPPVGDSSTPRTPREGEGSTSGHVG
jgi:hypothetical protein